MVEEGERERKGEREREREREEGVSVCVRERERENEAKVVERKGSVPDLAKSREQVPTSSCREVVGKISRRVCTRPEKRSRSSRARV
ncbi:hypothetical protein ALC62_01542 [Cyphomyrmex costatus]|uniref:Uncharacterized protein n=1 Tax=Cyphomyrmex costatus TaxID=456900 RepID=A0A195D354_9HYME|nr:hypothetical protein ALC62_01542 [Cyphomyrmex costatus]